MDSSTTSNFTLVHCSTLGDFKEVACIELISKSLKINQSFFTTLDINLNDESRHNKAQSLSTFLHNSVWLLMDKNSSLNMLENWFRENNFNFPVPAAILDISTRFENKPISDIFDEFESNPSIFGMLKNQTLIECYMIYDCLLRQSLFHSLTYEVRQQRSQQQESSTYTNNLNGNNSNNNNNNNNNSNNTKHRDTSVNINNNDDNIINEDNSVINHNNNSNVNLNQNNRVNDDYKSEEPPYNETSNSNNNTVNNVSNVNEDINDPNINNNNNNNIENNSNINDSYMNQQQQLNDDQELPPRGTIINENNVNMNNVNQVSKSTNTSNRPTKPPQPNRPISNNFTSNSQDNNNNVNNESFKQDDNNEDVNDSNNEKEDNEDNNNIIRNNIDNSNNNSNNSMNNNVVNNDSIDNIEPLNDNYNRNNFNINNSNNNNNNDNMMRYSNGNDNVMNSNQQNINTNLLNQNQPQQPKQPSSWAKRINQEKAPGSPLKKKLKIKNVSQDRRQFNRPPPDPRSLPSRNTRPFPKTKDQKDIKKYINDAMVGYQPVWMSYRGGKYPLIPRGIHPIRWDTDNNQRGGRLTFWGIPYRSGTGNQSKFRVVSITELRHKAWKTPEQLQGGYRNARGGGRDNRPNNQRRNNNNNNNNNNGNNNYNNSRRGFQN